MADVVVVGKGPAGVSAAVYVLRAGFSVSLVGKDEGALGKASRIENYYGFPAGVSGKELFRAGVDQAKALGAEVFDDEIVSAEFDGGFVFGSASSSYRGRAAVIACGVKRNSSTVPGLDKYEGRGVSRCAVCDGFFFRGKRVGVLGNGRYAASEASVLVPLASGVTVFTNGMGLSSPMPDGVAVDERVVDSLFGDGRLEGVVVAGGERIQLSGLFVALGTAGAGDFALKLGAVAEGSRIVVDEKCSTGVPGLFAAGDCTGGLLQIASAVHKGAVAGLEAVKYLKGL